MTVIARTDKSDYNNSNIGKSITLFEEFGMYFILTVEHKPGWFGYRDVEVVDTYAKYNKAVSEYIARGGQMRREF